MGKNRAPAGMMWSAAQLFADNTRKDRWSDIDARGYLYRTYACNAEVWRVVSPGEAPDLTYDTFGEAVDALQVFRIMAGRDPLTGRKVNDAD